LLKDLHASQCPDFQLNGNLSKIVLSYEKMMEYVLGCKTNMENPNIAARSTYFNQELSEAYLIFSESVKDWLQSFLSAELLRTLTGEDTSSDWFEQLFYLIYCINYAHDPEGNKISSEHIPLIRRMHQRYPNSQTFSFTLYKALSENTPRNIPCPEALELCLFAANKGHSQAEYYYARLLESGDFGAEKNPALSKDYLNRSSENGYFEAQFHLAKSAQTSEEADTHYELALTNPQTPLAIREKLLEDDRIFLPSQLSDYQCPPLWYFSQTFTKI